MYPSKGPARESITSYVRTDAYKLLPPIERSVRHEKRDFHKSAVASCESCHKNENDFEGRKPFMVCNACRNAVNRMIYYCSKCVCVDHPSHDIADYCDRECQRNDWRPRHKLICGKKMSLADANTMTATLPAPGSGSEKHRRGLFAKIVPARPGYKRSPALLHQIALLNSDTDPEASYFFMPSFDNLSAVVISDTIIQALFHGIRAQAMASGDRAAVIFLGQHFVRTYGDEVPPKDIFRQLEKEYGFDVQSAVTDLELRSAKECGGLTELQQRRKDFRGMNEDLCRSNDMTVEQKRKFIAILAEYVCSLP